MLHAKNLITTCCSSIKQELSNTAAGVNVPVQVLVSCQTAKLMKN